MAKKEKFTVTHPHYIRLPKDAISASGDSKVFSTLGMYDIVKQSKAIWRDSNWSLLLRSAEPFTIRFVTKGKTKEVSSRLKGVK